MSTPADPRVGLRPPEEEYRARRDERKATRRVWARRSNLLGAARLGVLLVAVIALGAALWQGRDWPWGQLLPLGAVFLVLIAIHERVVRRRDAAARAVAL